MTENAEEIETDEQDEPEEFDSMCLDFHGIPAEVVEKFQNLPVEELNRIAWRATQWSPGTFERQIVYQLRMTFKVVWKLPLGWGIHHANDNPDGGMGTLSSSKGATLPEATGCEVISNDY